MRKAAAFNVAFFSGMFEKSKHQGFTLTVFLSNAGETEVL